MGETGVVCSSVRANSAKASGDVRGVMISGRFGAEGGEGRISRGVGVGVFCALRAWSAFRRYSDLGATEKEGVCVSCLFGSGVDAPREGARGEGALAMLYRVLVKVWVRSATGEATYYPG
jgi:hypothetical protein